MHVLAMTAAQRAELEAAQRQSQNVRHWKRYQAVLLRADGTPVAVVAQTLGCSQASVSNWTVAWRQAGVAASRRGGRARGDPSGSRAPAGYSGGAAAGGGSEQ